MRANPTPDVPGGWVERGACRHYPTEWWFPGGEWYGPRTRRMWEADAAVARRICLECCPVRNECLVYALRHRELGLWGGLNEEERHALPIRKGAA